jgi:hypothetical protein
MVRKQGYQIGKMTKFTWALREQGSAILDASGNGRFQLAPGGAREKWTVNLITTFCTLTTTANPTLIIYRASVMPGNQIGGTYTGSLDTNSTDVWHLAMNEGLWFVYTGGPVGAQVNARIEGIREVWDRIT